MRGALLLLAGAVCCAAGYPADYAAWDRVLKKYVNVSGVREGVPVHVVDYCGIKADPDYAAFLKSLAAADATGLSKNDTYALYMNAYNALAINTIIQHPTKLGKCISSIQDIGLIPKVSVWMETAGTVAGAKMSLNDIEGLLRDPSKLGFEEDCRVHGCIVCASISCPNVRAEAYLPEKIDAQMDDNVRDWLANPKKGSAVVSDGVEVSKIAQWYAGDLQKCYGSAAAFLQRFGPPPVTKYIASHGAASVKLSYFDYDWNANGHVPCDC
eukprot:TRINITY_DN11963_c0_g1_i1.p2 TRINITY_DN11963_c0_g1~~TRINITY_DN11963_c0_g1_i1.p2  ORF type:complete len:269 (+),score=110.89 TRINITY_DN11963_c0_g1_i1:178-984(+)